MDNNLLLNNTTIELVGNIVVYTAVEGYAVAVRGEVGGRIACVNYNNIDSIEVISIEENERRKQAASENDEEQITQ
jgi:hypothetical protein